MTRIEKNYQVVTEIATKARYDYLNALIARRWNAFIGYLIANGLMLNALRDLRDGQDKNLFLIVAISLSGIILSALFLQLVSVLLSRIVAMYRMMAQADEELVIVGVGKEGSRILSVTGLLYLMIAILSLPWFFAFGSTLGQLVGSTYSKVVVAIAILLYIWAFSSLTWPVRGYVENLRRELGSRQRNTEMRD